MVIQQILLNPGIISHNAHNAVFVVSLCEIKMPGGNAALANVTTQFNWVARRNAAPN
jgi:hypothetical protein